MFRLILSLMVAFSFTIISYADPIKKAPKDDSDKLAKECFEAFFKAMSEGKAEEVVKLCSTPILLPSGEISDSLDSIKSETSRKMPAGFELKVTETITLEKFNEWSKKKGGKELSAEKLKQYGELMGKEGRIVIVEIKVNGKEETRDGLPNFLIRFKNGKATFCGVFRTFKE